MDWTTETHPPVHEDAERKISKVSAYTALDFFSIISSDKYLKCTIGRANLYASNLIR